MKAGRVMSAAIGVGDEARCGAGGNFTTASSSMQTSGNVAIAR